MNYNRGIIIGNITKDPELKALPSGGSVCNFSIATNRTWMDKTSGKKQEAVEFHNVVVFGRMADNVAQYIRKGSQLLVEGRIQTRSWEGKDGKKNYRTEIVAESIQFGAKPRDEGRPSSPLNEEQEIDIADIPF